MSSVIPLSTKLVGVAAICIALYASLASYLYLGSLKELSSLQEQYKSLQGHLQEEIDSKAKLKESIKQDEQHSKDLQEKLSNAEKEKETLQGKINNIPSKRCPKQQGVEYVPIEANVADIDDRLPDELIGVLKQSDSQASGSSSSASR